MPAKDILELVDTSNEAILNGIRNDASLDYQRRVPEATKANMQEMIDNLRDNRPGYNEFVDALVNRIGLTIGRNMIWSNPLAWAKIGMLTHGDTIEEYAVGLLEAHTYENDREAGEHAIFGTERPPVKAIFHKRNRQEYYKITINENALFAAFLTGDGISKFVTQLMQSPATSDQWDEYKIMCNLFTEYDRNNGFYKVHVEDVSALESNADAAKDAIRKTRALTKNMQFPSTKYNPAGMPSFANPDELILFATAEYQAAVDVEALAGAFNPDKLTMPRIVTIRQEDFNIPGVQAILTTKDFFVVADTKIQTEQARNPVKMHTNYFLHHQGVYSVSTFAPAILFTTGEGTEDAPLAITPVTSVTPVTVTNRENETVTSVTRSEIYNIVASAVTTPTGGENDAVRFSLTGNTAPRTRVTQNGVLHVGGTEGAEALVIKATAVWTDPEGISRDGLSTSTSVTVTGPKASDWPVAEDAQSAAAAFSLRQVPETETLNLGKDETPPPVDYSTLKNEELQAILSERGLDTSGVKTVMIERLIESDNAPA